MDLEDILNGEDSDDEDVVEDRALDVDRLLYDEYDSDDDAPPSMSPAQRGTRLVSTHDEWRKENPLPAVGTEAESQLVVVGPAAATSMRLTADNLSQYLSDLGVDMDDKDDKQEWEEDAASSANPPIYSHLHLPKTMEIATQAARQALSLPTSVSSLKSVNSDIILSALNKRKKNSLSTSAYSNIKWNELTTVSQQLKKNSGYEAQSPGRATCLCVHNKFIVVGTSKGFILLFDNAHRYGPEFEQNNDLVLIMGSTLQAPGARSGAEVTALEICATFFQSFPVMACGYASGEVALWDVAKGTVLRRVVDLHKYRIAKIQFLLSVDTGFAALDSQGGGDYFVVSVDEMGNLHRVRFSKNMWGGYSHESSCLLDGGSGSILDMNVLPPIFEPTSVKKQREIIMNEDQKDLKTSVSKSLGLLPINSQYLAFSLQAKTCIVQLNPTVKVIYKWDLTSEALSCVGARSSIEWQWIHQSQSDVVSVRVPSLARCHGPCVDILGFALREAALLSPPSMTAANDTASAAQWTVSGEYRFELGRKRVFLGSNFMDVRWLSPSKLILLSARAVLVLISSDLSLLEQSSLEPSILQDVLWEGRASNVSMCNTCLFLLAKSDAVFKVQMQSCFEQADQLSGNGQWLEALALILDSVETTPSLLQSNYDDVDSFVTNYLSLAIQHPVAEAAETASSAGHEDGGGVSPQTKTHFHLVAGVCIEYCVLTSRTSTLFTRIYELFVSSSRQMVFLECLEPFIIAGSLPVLPDSIICDFLDGFVKEGRGVVLNRCVAFLDVSLNVEKLSVVTRCLFENSLDASFLYAYSYGWGDFCGAFQLVFNRLSGDKDSDTDQNEDKARHKGRGSDRGYQLLLFLLFSFEDKVFPRGIPLVDFKKLVDRSVVDRDGSVDIHSEKKVLERKKLLLKTVASYSAQPLESKILGSKDLSTGGRFASVDSAIAKDGFPFLTVLARHDVQALFYCMFKGTESILLSSPLVDYGAEMSLVFENIYTFCKEGKHGQPEKQITKIFFDQFICLFVNYHGSLQFGMLGALLRYIDASKPASERSINECTASQLTERQSKYHSQSALRELLISSNFWKAALSVKQYPLHAYRQADFDEAVKFYVSVAATLSEKHRAGQGAVDESLDDSRALVFDFIAAAFSYLAFTEGELCGQLSALCTVVTNNVTSLAAISLAQTKAVVREHFRDSQCVLDIISVTTQRDQPRLQFDLLDALIGALLESGDCIALSDMFSSRSVVQYVSLLCKYEPQRVLGFLKVADGLYPMDECLILCRDAFAIADGQSFLLQKSGDHAGALNVMLKEFTVNVKAAKKSFDSQVRQNGHKPQRAGEEQLEMEVISQILSKMGAERVQLCHKLRVFEALTNIVNRAADVCATAQRTLASSRLSPSRSRSSSLTLEQEQECEEDKEKDTCGMWFRTFDYLLVERQSIRSGTASSSGEITIILIGLMLQILMTRMKGIITPADIIRRVTATETNSSGIRLGEFKDVMLNMLSDLGAEYVLSNTVRQIIRQDLRRLHREKNTKMRRPCLTGSGAFDEQYLDAAKSLSIAPAQSSTQRKAPSKPGRRRQHQQDALGGGMIIHACLPSDMSEGHTPLEARQPGSLAVQPVVVSEYNS